jgi:hypothetical protein
MKTTGRDFLVYAAGPIAGLTYAEGQDWRVEFAASLPEEIRVMSPLRAKSQRLAREGVIVDGYEDNPLTSQRGLTTRDRQDCLRADAVVYNFLGAKKVSIGSCIELGWADSKRIPIILVMEPSGNVHDHCMVRDLAGFRVDSLEKAAEILEAILMPEGHGTRRMLPLPPGIVPRKFSPRKDETLSHSLGSTL